jgi:dynein heavy chain
LTKGYGETQLRDFIRNFYDWAGHSNIPSTFLLTDSEVLHEYFLEFINMILSTGEIPNLIAKDDRDVWLLNIKSQLQKKKGKSYDPTNEELWEIFINRVRD